MRKKKIPPFPGYPYLVEFGVHHTMNEEQKQWFRDNWPKNLNRDIIEAMGCAASTVSRWSRRLKLKKDRRWEKGMRKRVAEKAARTNWASGYYESLKGQPPSQEALDAYQRKLATGWSPWVEIRKNKQHYNEICRNRGERRRKLIAVEKTRQDYGVKRQTKLHIPATPFTRKQVCMRYGFVRLGYIIGDMRERMGERMNIYFDDETQRSAIRERHATAEGFRFLPLNE